MAKNIVTQSHSEYQHEDIAEGEGELKPSGRLSTGGAIYSLCPTSSYLVVGGRDCLQGWEWGSLAQARATPSPSWEISLPGRGEVNCIAVVADEGCEDRVVVGM